MRKLIAALIATAMLGLVPATQASGAAFKNCAELRKSYQYGISLSSKSVNKGVGPIFGPRVNAAVFRLNKKLDLDRDNIICEVRKPSSSQGAGPSPAPTPSQTAAPADSSYEAPSLASDDVELCRIQEASRSRGMTGAGFPAWNTLTPSKGVVKWALIPIDFEDLPGEQNFRTRVDDQMVLLSDWFETVSGGKYKVEWVVLDKWARVAGKSTDYAIDRSVNVGDASNGPKLFRAAMDAADPHFDFTNIQTVNFILPKGQTFLTETSQGFPWDQVVKDYQSKEGKVASYSIPGMFFDLPGKAYWSYWAHEFGHAIGLPHIGTSRGDMPPFNPWDLMGGQDGPSRELSGWLRFFAGWLNDDQVYCKDASKVQDLKLSLVPLSQPAAGVKFAVIPITKTKAVLIESRRENKFSCSTNPARNGVLVYTYDATLGHGENFLTPIYPDGRPNQVDSCSAQNNRGTRSPNVLLSKGETIEVEGLRIEVLSTGTVDKILVTKK